MLKHFITFLRFACQFFGFCLSNIKSSITYQQIVSIKPIEWLFSITKLDLKIDFKELRIAENNLIILLNIIDDYYTLQ